MFIAGFCCGVVACWVALEWLERRAQADLDQITKGMQPGDPSHA